MPTNKWQVSEPMMATVVIERVEDGIPILSMCVADDDSEPGLSLDEARDIAQDIVDDWNFSCDELES